MNLIRVIGVGAWLLMAIVFGVVQGKLQWRTPLPYVAAYFTVALTLFILGSRFNSVLGRCQYTVAFVDVTMMFAAMNASVAFYPEKSSAAGLLLSMFMLLIGVALLTMQRRAVFAAVATAIPLH